MNLGKNLFRREKPSIFALVAAGDVEGLRKVLKAGADANEADSNGLAALQLAAMRGDDACVAALIENGADIDMRDSLGWTPLMHAIQQGKKVACVKVLLKLGADPSAALKSGIDVITLTNNSTPDIREAVQSVLDERSQKVLSTVTEFTGLITLFIAFELVKLHVEIVENEKGGISFGIPGSRVDGLTGKAIKIDFIQAKARLGADELNLIGDCCVKIEKRFTELILANDWDPHSGAFRLTKLLPIVVNELEPWTKAHLTYKEMEIGWSMGETL